MKRKAVYAGSFDPITKGHLDIVRRALGVFDRVVVSVAYNPAKETGLFTAVERVAMIREALTDRTTGWRSTPSTDCWWTTAIGSGAHAIIRGLRAVSDFEYEFQMAMMNRHLNDRVETYFMTASEAYFYTASRLVKEVASLGGNVSGSRAGGRPSRADREAGTQAELSATPCRRLSSGPTGSSAWRSAAVARRCAATFSCAPATSSCASCRCRVPGPTGS